MGTCPHAFPFLIDWTNPDIGLVVPKPTGFCFLDVAERTGFKPPDELEEFLAAGPPPVYFGWGSLVVDDPKVCRYSTNFHS